jgi:hypothetical protein
LPNSIGDVYQFPHGWLYLLKNKSEAKIIDGVEGCTILWDVKVGWGDGSVKTILNARI